ncbi:MAG: hypothetical protein AMXMBFR84_04320 [Candidatus Hydrogenedentota bacterium]
MLNCIMQRIRWGLLLAFVLPGWTDDVQVPIELFNGRDLAGWFVFIPDANIDPGGVWVVQDGVLRTSGVPHGYIRTTQKYADYRLTFEWRWPEQGGNSGVLLHLRDKDEVWPEGYETQLQSEHAGDMFVIGEAEFKEHTDPNDRRVIKKRPHNEKPIGEWNEYEIVCEDNTIRVRINGQEQNAATECTVAEGYIGFQSEGTPIEFRNLTLWPLDGIPAKDKARH